MYGERNAPGRHGHQDRPFADRGDLVIPHRGVAGAEVHALFSVDVLSDEATNALAAANRLVGYDLIPDDRRR